MRIPFLACGALVLTGAAAGAVIGAGLAAPGAAQTPYALGYAHDRALIEDLLGRYAFAVDFQDADAYGATFAEDAVLVHGRGVEEGRAAIVAFMEGFAPDEDGLRPSRWQHNITNLVLEIAPDGQTAEGLAEWVQMGNDNPDRVTEPGYFGHSEDKYVKVDGQWLFARREIYNEGIPERSAAGQRNPVHTMWDDAPTPTFTERDPRGE